MAAPWLMVADDSRKYLVKFANERTDNSILSEVICARLAKKLDLPIPEWDFINIDQDMIDNTKDLTDRQIQPGKHFASLFVDGSTNLPNDHFSIPINHIDNKNQIPGIIAFDTFVCNNDRKEANSLIAPLDDSREKYEYWMIDHGLCFGSHTWNEQSLDSLPMRPSGIPWNTDIISGSDSFEPFIEKLRKLDRNDFEEVVKIPTEWNHRQEDLSKLTETLVNRSEDQIINVLQGLHNSNDSVFRKWV